MFGHLSWVALQDPEELFRAELADLLDRLGLPPQAALTA